MAKLVALQGKIESVALHDAIRHIAEHRNTGVLTVSKSRKKIEISFLEGDLLRVDYRSRPKKMRLGALMNRAGFVSLDQIAYALSIQRETLQRIGKVFCERFGVESELLDEFVRLQNTDGFFEVLLWKRGEFEFIAKEVSVAWDRSEPIKTDYLLTEAARFLGDWEDLRTARPKPQAGFAQAKPLPVIEDGVLSADDRRLFRAFEKPRSYDSALYRSRLGGYRGARAVRTLRDEGHLEPAKPQKDFSVSWFSRGLGRLQPMQVLSASLIYWLIILCFWALFMLADLSWYGMSWQGVHRYQAKPVSNYEWAQSMKLIRRGLNVYKLRHGQYPDSLGALSKDWILSSEVLTQPKTFYWSDAKKYYLGMSQGISSADTTVSQ